MRIDFASESAAQAAVSIVSQVLTGGGVVLLPTETFYGLAAMPGDSLAVDRIRRMKGRPSDMAFPVLCANWNQVETAVEVPRQYRSILTDLWPGAITVVLPGRNWKPAASSDGSLAVRIPDHPVLCRLLEEVGPVTGTSANRHGAAPCRTVFEALNSLLEDPDLVLDGGPTFGGKSSTLVDLRPQPPRVLRKGPVVWSAEC